MKSKNKELISRKIRVNLRVKTIWNLRVNKGQNQLSLFAVTLKNEDECIYLKLSTVDPLLAQNLSSGLRFLGLRVKDPFPLLAI